MSTGFHIMRHMLGRSNSDAQDPFSFSNPLNAMPNSIYKVLLTLYLYWFSWKGNLTLNQYIIMVADGFIMWECPLNIIIINIWVNLWNHVHIVNENTLFNQHKNILMVLYNSYMVMWKSKKRYLASIPQTHNSHRIFTW